jgi:hypothetical protein
MLTGILGLSFYLLDVLLIKIQMTEIVRLMTIGILFILFYFFLSQIAKIRAVADFKQLILKR